MNNIVRICPDSKTGLIKWIEDNYHEIDQFVGTFLMKDNTTMTIYDTYTYLEAAGITELQRDTIHEEAHNETFVCKDR